MILQLRRRHRQIWHALGLLLPALLILAMITRRGPTVMDRLPPELLASTLGHDESRPSSRP